MCTYSKFVNYYFCSNGHSITIPGRGPLDKKGSYNHTTKQQTRKSAWYNSLRIAWASDPPNTSTKLNLLKESLNCLLQNLRLYNVNVSSSRQTTICRIYHMKELTKCYKRGTFEEHAVCVCRLLYMPTVCV